MKSTSKLNDVVALLTDVPEQNLARGQVGTVVEVFSGTKMLVEFADDDGKAYSIVTVSATNLLVLHYEKEVA